MKNRVVIFSFIFGLVLTGLALGQPYESFLPYYYLKGRISGPDGVSVKDREVLFFKNNLDNAVKVLTDDQGKFELNVWDLDYYGKDEAEIETGIGIYHVAVSNESDNYGVKPTLITLNPNEGFTTLPTMVLALGEGKLLKIDTPSPLTSGQVGLAYHQLISASGGASGYVWSIASGSLPPGITSSFDEYGLKLEGVPTQAGIFTFEAKVADTKGIYTQKEFTLTINDKEILGGGPVILHIERAGAHLNLTWEVNTANYPEIAAEMPIILYLLPGTGEGSYTNNYEDDNWINFFGSVYPTQLDSEKFVSIYDESVKCSLYPSQKLLCITNQVGNASTLIKEMYFKALPVVETWIPGNYLPQVAAVGKVDLTLKPKYSSVSLPLRVNDYHLKSFVGDQLSEGDQIHYWDQAKQTYGMVTKTTAWPDRLFATGEGFFVWVNGNAPETLTIVGNVGGFPDDLSIPVGKEYTLLGYPYPTSIEAENSGLSPVEGDQLHKWAWDGQAFVMTTFVNSNWNEPSVKKFSLGEAKFYYILKIGSSYQWKPKF